MDTNVNHIMVGLAINEKDATPILQRACQVAKPSTIEAVHACCYSVVEFPEAPLGVSTIYDMETKARRFLTRVCKPFGIERHNVVHGPALYALNKLSENDTDLFVLGSHSHHGWHGMLNSTSRDLVYKLNCDVLAVHLADSETPTTYRRILAAIDLSDDSNQVLEHAQAIANRTGAEIALAYVQRHQLDSNSNSNWDRLLQVAERFGISDANVYLVAGKPVPAIRRLAEELGSDLLAVGAHHKTGRQRFTCSSAAAMLHGLSCDELAVKIH